jgi:hypothetical protein
VLDQPRGIGRNPTVLRSVLREIEDRRQQDALGIQGEKADIESELKEESRPSHGLGQSRGSLPPL